VCFGLIILKDVPTDEIQMLAIDTVMAGSSLCCAAGAQGRLTKDANA